MAISVSGQRSHTRSIHRIPKLSSSRNTPAPIRISASAVTPDPEFLELEQVVIALTPVWIVRPPVVGFTRLSANVARLPAKDRKSTRLNSSHSQISYAVFCLKKKQIERCRLAHPVRRIQGMHAPPPMRGLLDKRACVPVSPLLTHHPLPSRSCVEHDTAVRG